MTQHSSPELPHSVRSEEMVVSATIGDKVAKTPKQQQDDNETQDKPSLIRMRMKMHCHFWIMKTLIRKTEMALPRASLTPIHTTHSTVSPNLSFNAQPEEGHEEKTPSFEFVFFFIIIESGELKDGSKKNQNCTYHTKKKTINNNNNNNNNNNKNKGSRDTCGFTDDEYESYNMEEDDNSAYMNPNLYTTPPPSPPPNSTTTTTTSAAVPSSGKADAMRDNTYAFEDDEVPNEGSGDEEEDDIEPGVAEEGEEGENNTCSSGNVDTEKRDQSLTAQ
ncbi:hypothetical protein RFI_10196, partial [Reticulomyxa filosa]